MKVHEKLAIDEEFRASQNITVSQVTAFLAAADCGSFSQAAERLCLSQPALSRCIKDMESALGGSLFDRSCKGVVLSSKGSRLLPMAKRLLKSYSDAHMGMTHWRYGREARLNLVGSASVMPVVVPALVRNLEKEFGHAAMCISEALSVEVRQQVLDGRAWLGVCVDIEDHPRLRYTPVLEVQFGLLTPASFDSTKRIDSLQDLDGLSMVRCIDRAIVTQVLRQHGIFFPAYFDAPIVVNDVQAATELVQNHGLLTVATGVGASHSKAKGLHFIPLPGLLPQARVYIVSLRDAVFDEHHERLRTVLHASIHDAPWHPSVRRLGKMTSMPTTGERT